MLFIAVMCISAPVKSSHHQQMVLFVTNPLLATETAVVEVPPDSQVQDVKTKLLSDRADVVRGLQSHQYSLQFTGVTLDDDSLLADQGIGAESTLHVVLHLALMQQPRGYIGKW